MWENGRYKCFKSDQSTKSSDEMAALFADWVARYPIVLLEDPIGEADWEGWKTMTRTLGDKVEIVGDNICTNAAILAEGIAKGAANSVLIKLNQIGTVTETLDTIELARANGYHCFMSHRSGETEDTFLADLTGATGAGHLKTGSRVMRSRQTYPSFSYLPSGISHERSSLGNRPRHDGKLRPLRKRRTARRGCHSVIAELRKHLRLHLWESPHSGSQCLRDGGTALSFQLL